MLFVSIFFVMSAIKNLRSFPIGAMKKMLVIGHRRFLPSLEKIRRNIFLSACFFSCFINSSFFKSLNFLCLLYCKHCLEIWPQAKMRRMPPPPHPHHQHDSLTTSLPYKLLPSTPSFTFLHLRLSFWIPARNNCA